MAVCKLEQEYVGTIIQDVMDTLLPEELSYTKPYIKVYGINGNSFEIHYGKEYEAPELNFDVLVKLSELFGTRKIDVDNYSQGGCETCDWGSDYRHEIKILEATKGLSILDYVGKEIYPE